MNIKELRSTIRTYKDLELEGLHEIYALDEEYSITKTRIVEDEMSRREIAREEGTYYDETLSPRVSIPKRLDAIRKNISK